MVLAVSQRQRLRFAENLVCLKFPPTQSVGYLKCLYIKLGNYALTNEKGEHHEAEDYLPKLQKRI